MATPRVVHYLNQFFAGVGAEAQAAVPPGRADGAIGPARLLQQALGDQAVVVATIYCGDNYANERPGAVDEILALAGRERPDILVAGPAFAAGRYGLVCGELCARARAELGVTVVSGMHPDNPAAELYRSRVYLASTRETAAGMADAIQTMARLALRLHAAEPLGTPQDAGYIPTGRRIHYFAEQTAAERAVELLLKKVAGEPVRTEWPVPTYGLVEPAAPVADVARAKIALVTSGGVVPRGNPDRLESAYATKWLRYSIAGLDALDAPAWQSVHGGFDTTNINEDPHRMAPLDALRALEREGAFGQLDEHLYTTVGNTSAIPTMRRFAGEIVEHLRADGVEGVILTAA
jgi:glycine reductase complex component B subunit gamma